MKFGIYVHTQGPSAFREVATALDHAVRKSLDSVDLADFDGLYLSYHSTSEFAAGLKRLKRKVRHDYRMKVLTGGTHHYKCLIEFEAQVADAELIDSSTTKSSLLEWVRSIVTRSLPEALSGFSSESLSVVHAAVVSAQPTLAQHW